MVGSAARLPRFVRGLISLALDRTSTGFGRPHTEWPSSSMSSPSSDARIVWRDSITLLRGYGGEVASSV
jgi:hypothetical protein